MVERVSERAFGPGINPRVSDSLSPTRRARGDAPYLEAALATPLPVGGHWPAGLSASPMQDDESRGRKRQWLRRALRFVGAALILLGLILLFWLRGALYNRFIRFPREEAAWQTLRAQRRPVLDDAGWTEY